MRIYRLALVLLTAGFLQAQVVGDDLPTLAQVDELLSLMHSADAQGPLLHERLEKQRSTLPAWFPRDVWDDVEKQVEAIHYADACLPAYQKYMTSEQVRLMSLLLTGPTGQEIANNMSRLAERAARQGYSGYEADKQVGKSMQGDSTIPNLMAKRLSEFSAGDRAKIQANLVVMQKAMPPIETDCMAQYNARGSEVIKTVLAKHNAEINIAQHAHSTKH